jgi:ABC-type uncharacterized transport system permease subunit
MAQRAGNSSALFGVPVRKRLVATRALAAAAAGLAATSLVARASHQEVEPHWHAFIAAAGTDEGHTFTFFS